MVTDLTDWLFFSHHSVEVHQEHPENHQVHEDGGRRQVRSCWAAAEAGPGIRHRRPRYAISTRFRSKRTLPQTESVSYSAPAALYEKADIKAPEDKASKHLIVGVTSDRGLCGAIHSGVAKTIKSEIANLTGAGKEVMVINVGDKLRGLLYRWEPLQNRACRYWWTSAWPLPDFLFVRTHGKHILLNCKEVGRKPPNFGDASVIAAELLNSGYEFDQGSIVFNRFRYRPGPERLLLAVN